MAAAGTTNACKGLPAIASHRCAPPTAAQKRNGTMTAPWWK